MANGIGGCLRTEIPAALVVALTPPAQTPVGSVLLLGCGKGVHHVAGEVAVLAVAAGQHDRGQFCQLGSVGEQACVAGDTAHRVVALLVVHLALNGGGAHAGEGDGTITGVAVQLGSGAVVGGKAVQQGVVGGVGQPHGVPEGLLQEGVQTLAGDCFNGEGQQHIVHVGVDGLGAGFIHQRSLEDGLEGRGAGCSAAVPTGEEHVGGTGNGLLSALVKGIVVVLGVCREACLMAQDIAQGQFCFPLLVDLQARVLVAVVGNVDGVLHKGAAQQVYQTAVQIGLALRDEVL